MRTDHGRALPPRLREDIRGEHERLLLVRGCSRYITPVINE